MRCKILTHRRSCLAPAAHTMSAEDYPVPLIYQFKVTLRDIKPPIWRRIEVPGNFSFFELHCAITDAMGWADYHQYRFSIAHHCIESTDTFSPGDFRQRFCLVDDKTTNIEDFFHKICPKNKGRYLYDITGDRWDHHIVLEAIKNLDRGVQYPRCVTGRRACPPTDCGGIVRYKNILKIIADFQHPEYNRTVEYLDSIGLKNFNPERFEPISVEFDKPEDHRLIHQFREDVCNGTFLLY